MATRVGVCDMRASQGALGCGIAYPLTCAGERFSRTQNGVFMRVWKPAMLRTSTISSRPGYTREGRVHHASSAVDSRGHVDPGSAGTRAVAGVRIHVLRAQAIRPPGRRAEP